MRMKTIASLIGFSVLWSGCAAVKPHSSLEHWKNFNSTSSLQMGNLASDQAMVVFIREKETLTEPAANIFVEGEYLTSLQSGGFKAIPLCAVPTSITAAFTQAPLNYAELRKKKQEYVFSSGQIYYFKIVDAEYATTLQLKALNKDEAEKILPGLQEQIHTLPRIEKNRVCPKIIYTPVVTPQPVVKKYTLQANTLFAYAKSGPNDMLQKGRDQVSAIAEEIARDQDKISHISVIGYTDPVGTETFNQQLSQRRAETVRALLVQNGIAKRNVLIEGRGEQELIVTDCQERYPKNKLAREQCDLPNRRVEIVTYGMTAK